MFGLYEGRTVMTNQNEVGINIEYCKKRNNEVSMNRDLIDMTLKVQEIFKRGNDAEVRYNANGSPKVYEIVRSLQK